MANTSSSEEESRAWKSGTQSSKSTAPRGKARLGLSTAPQPRAQERGKLKEGGREGGSGGVGRGRGQEQGRAGPEVGSDEQE